MSGMLSPSEIHSLFAGLDLVRGEAGGNGSLESTCNAPIGAEQFTLPLELAAVERDALQVWQSAFAERWMQTWPEAIRHRWSISNIVCEVTRLRDFVAAQGDWRRFQVATVSSEFTHWLAVDDRLVVAHLDSLLGACDIDSDGSLNRTWGPLEQQLTLRLVNGVSDSLFPTTTGLNRSGWKLSAVDSAEDLLAGVPVFLSCELIQFDIEVACSAARAHLQIAIPRGLSGRWLETKSSLATSSSQPVGDPSGETVSLRATLNPVTLSQPEFDQLQVGDVLLTGEDAGATCRVSLNGQPKFQATIGSRQGHKAVRLSADGL